MPHVEVERQRTILVVDDDLMTRDLIRLILKQTKLQVFEAVDGFDALEKIRQKMPDLVLLDAMMPRMDGFTVCKTLRSEEKTADLPIIMLSTRADQKARNQGEALQATKYLTKPILPSTLIEVIYQALGITA